MRRSLRVATEATRCRTEKGRLQPLAEFRASRQTSLRARRARDVFGAVLAKGRLSRKGRKGQLNKQSVIIPNSKAIRMRRLAWSVKVGHHYMHPITPPLCLCALASTVCVLSTLLICSLASYFLHSIILFTLLAAVKITHIPTACTRCAQAPFARFS